MSTQITSVSANVLIDGTWITYDGFVYNSSTGYWEKEITAPSKSSFLNNPDHFYSVEVTAQDEAGNSKSESFKDNESLWLFVIEKDAPTVTLSGITQGASTNNAKPTINIAVSDTNSGVSTAGCYAVIDAGSQNAVTLMKNGDYDASGSFTPSTSLSDGEHTITVFAKDNDGNTGSSSVSFSVLTSAPDLTISSPNKETTITNSKTIIVSGQTNTNTGNTVTITLDGTSQGTITLDASGNFSKTLTVSTDGTHNIVVTSTNSAGVSTTVNRTVIIDTVKPVFTEVIINPNPVELDKATTYTIRVKVQ